jgi:hypothetical protein
MYVEANSASTVAWKISRRFREFDALSSALRTHASGADLPALPPKTFFNSPSVIASRRPELDAFLAAICKKPALLSHGCVRAFLNLKVQVRHKRFTVHCSGLQLLPLFVVSLPSIRLTATCCISTSITSPCGCIARLRPPRVCS